MVGSNVNREQPRARAFHESDNAQAQFLRELRLLYQHSLRARSAATAARSTLGTGDPLPTSQQHSRQAEDTAAPVAAEDDPCPTQAPAPVLLDLIFSQPTPAEAAATLAAAGAITSNAARTATAAPRTTTDDVWELDADDLDDEPPPGMLDSSESQEEQEEEEGDHDEEEEEYDVDDEQAGVEGEGNDLRIIMGFGSSGTPAQHVWGSRNDTQPHSTQLGAQPRHPVPQDVEMEEADAGANTPSRSAMPAIRRAWQRANRTVSTARRPGQQQQQQPAADIGQLLPILQAHQCRQPAPCSFLQRGVVFSGCQTLTQLGMRRRDEQWRVTVTIQDVDHSRGYVAGTMQASNVPGSQQAIETFWEGCIIDDANHTFYTHGWGANKHTDIQHWAKFEGWSECLRRLVLQHSGRCGALEQHPLIYMRWKERFFTRTEQQQCGLSIAGFYYVALHRATGQLKGYYFDPSSSPFQELNMTAAHISSRPTDSSSTDSSWASAGGLSFVSYSFA